MAFTLLIVRGTQYGEELCRRQRLFISQEYLPKKDRDSSGQVLPDQEWQHPEADQLNYCEMGHLVLDDRCEDLIELVLHQGVTQLGGHSRLIVLEECTWIDSRVETWSRRQDREAMEYQDYLARRESEEMLRKYEEDEARRPEYAYCERCERETESCKGPSHRGGNRCMTCGGGLGDAKIRHCVNCIDLPFRKKREEVLGRPIIYRGEEPLP
jgi:hypothetical protein